MSTTASQQILSVMVVTLNEAPHIPLLKKALAHLDMPPGWHLETILVDGGSSDGTVEAALDVGFDECVVLDGASIPVCRNHAIKMARGNALAFLDGDCIPAADWLRVAMPYLERTGPVMIGFPVHPPPSGNWIHRAWHTHWRHKNSATDGAAAAEPFTDDAFRQITTRNMLFNRALLEVVPQFNETLTTGEDTDFAFRAVQVGAEVIAVPQLVVTHLGEPSTLAQYFRQQLWHANRKAYATILKNTGGRRGANAIFFSIAFLGGLVAAVLGLMMALLLREPVFLLGLLPLLLVTLAPALLIALRARYIRLLPGLIVLYFL